MQCYYKADWPMLVVVPASLKYHWVGDVVMIFMVVVMVVVGRCLHGGDDSYDGVYGYDGE